MICVRTKFFLVTVGFKLGILGLAWQCCIIGSTLCCCKKIVMLFVHIAYARVLCSNPTVDMNFWPSRRSCSNKVFYLIKLSILKSISVHNFIGWTEKKNLWDSLNSNFPLCHHNLIIKNKLFNGIFRLIL